MLPESIIKPLQWGEIFNKKIQTKMLIVITIGEKM